ncbi:MAG: hypothetical protein WD451_15225, partial [Thermoanaerobaculia bacterium]
MSKRFLVALFAALGLAIYLWPAFTAPVVLNSDSEIDLGWARAGSGIVSPAPAPRHLAKPGYLLFLRTLIAAGPQESLPRRIVVVQSLLVWLAICLAAALIARRNGVMAATIAYLLFVSFARLRDSCSIVMPEALTTALALPIAAALLRPPTQRVRAALLGASVGALFLVRPNVGGIMILLMIAAYAVSRNAAGLLPATIAFIALALPVWAATTPPDCLRGSSSTLEMGSRDYSWDLFPSGVDDPGSNEKPLRGTGKPYCRGGGRTEPGCSSGAPATGFLGPSTTTRSGLGAT